MKLKITSLLVVALSFSPMISSGQETAPAAPPAQAEAWIPSTPLEKRAVGLSKTMKKIPGIVSSIKDQATMDVAKKSMTALNIEVDAHIAEIKKLPIPDAAIRKSLSSRMEKEMAALGPQMQQAMMGMAALPLELAPQVQAMMIEFAGKMEKHETDMNKYFESDEDRAKKNGK